MRHNEVKYVILMRAFKCTVVRREVRFMEYTEREERFEFLLLNK